MEKRFFESKKDLDQIRTIYAFSLPCQNHADKNDYCTDVGTILTKEKCLKSALLLSTCPNQCNNCEIIKENCPALGDHLCSVAKEWVRNG